MKILAVIGSPRKGNTYQTVKKIEQIHMRLAECEYEYLFLKDLDLGRCAGCFVCISQGEEHCPFKDDRDLIIQKIESADGVILACPNYVSNVPWLTKNFIDRFAFIMHRPKYFNRKFMIVITSGSYMGVKDAMRALSLMASGGEIVSRLGVFNSPGMNDNKKKIQEAKIKKSAVKFAKQLNRKPGSRPPFSFLIWFSAFKASSAVNKESFPADYAYYANKDYFVDNRLDIFQKTVITVFTRFFGFLFNRGLI
jgi:Multimeric flavodoxin WrbA